MAITHNILNLGDGLTVAATGIKVPNKTTYKVVDTVAEPGRREATYQKVVGDSEYPLSVRVGHYPQPKANGGVGQTNISAKLSTFVRKADADEIIYTLPFTATLAISSPGLSGIPNTVETVEVLSYLMTFLTPVISGLFSGVALDELKYGVVGNLAAHVDSNA